jgi:hypothetical protein
MRLLSIVILCANLLAGACIYEEDGPAPIEASGTLDDFENYVQPVLQVGCASLDCHGNAGRPLRLYAKNGLRAEADLRGYKASFDEMRANILAIDGLDPFVDQIEDHLLLLKPLAVDAGGIHHVGGDLWADQTDKVYRCLHAWLRAGVSDNAGRSVCTEVLP